MVLTHWGRAMHICVSKLTIIGSDNGMSPGRRQAIIWTNAGILLIGTLGTNFSEILSEIHTFSFKNIRLNTSSAKWRPFCLSLNELNPKVRVQLMVFDGVNTGSSSLLPKTIPEPMLTHHHWCLVAFTCVQFHKKCSRNQSLEHVWKNYISRLKPHRSDANHLPSLVWWNILG